MADEMISLDDFETELLRELRQFRLDLREDPETAYLAHQPEAPMMPYRAWLFQFLSTRGYLRLSYKWNADADCKTEG